MALAHYSDPARRSLDPDQSDGKISAPMFADECEEAAMTMRSMSDLVSRQRPLMLPPDTTVRSACEHMRERGVGAVLVTDDQRRLLGIFTGRDAVCRVLAEGKAPGVTKLAEAMTPRPDTIGPGRTAIEALRLMQDGGYRHLPVVDGRQVVGIVSRGDFRGLEQARLDEETGLWECV
jgi:CBS domain-containing protein